jgi:hypothetical protein
LHTGSDSTLCQPLSQLLCDAKTTGVMHFSKNGDFFHYNPFTCIVI